MPDSTRPAPPAGEGDIVEQLEGEARIAEGRDFAGWARLMREAADRLRALSAPTQDSEEHFVRVSKAEWAHALEAMGIPREKWQADTLAAAGSEEHPSVGFYRRLLAMGFPPSEAMRWLWHKPLFGPSGAETALAYIDAGRSDKVDAEIARMERAQGEGK